MISVIVFLPMQTNVHPKIPASNPPNPPFLKGGYWFPPLEKGDKGEFSSVFVSPHRGLLAVHSKILLWIICLLSLHIISGCAGNVILADDAMRIRNTVDMISQLKGLYEAHDEGILTLFTSEYLVETGMKDAISLDMERFSAISLNIFIDRMEVDKDLVNVSVQWDGSWGSDEKILREGGSAVIIIRSDGGLKVVDIKGDSPFGKSKR